MIFRNTMPMADYSIATIELKRVQHYLFGIPRLSVMLGANVLLGELTRGIWDASNRSFKGGSKDDPDPAPSLPALATRMGSCFPGDGDFQLNLQCMLESTIGAENFSAFTAENDPLKYEDQSQDDPLQIAFDTGVLVRDASRLEAIFASEHAAASFISAARKWIGAQIPEIAVSSLSLIHI